MMYPLPLKKEFGYILMARDAVSKPCLQVIVNQCHSVPTEPFERSMPSNERCTLGMIPQEHFPLSGGCLCYRAFVDKMEHSEADFTVLAAQGLLSECHGDERGNQKELQFVTFVEEHPTRFCAVYF